MNYGAIRMISRNPPVDIIFKLTDHSVCFGSEIKWTHTKSGTVCPLESQSQESYKKSSQQWRDKCFFGLDCGKIREHLGAIKLIAIVSTSRALATVIIFLHHTG